MQVTKIVSVEKLKPLNLRPIVESRVSLLRENIAKNGYDPACPLVVQPDNGSYLVVNGCHRLAALPGLPVEKVPVVEYPPEEDPVQLALKTQENDEGVQPWDFLDRAYLVKKLYEELGTQEKVAEKLGWKGKNSVHYYLSIANLPKDVFTVIRNSVNRTETQSVNEEVHDRERKYLDNIWKPTWFRHICALPREDFKFEAVSEIAQNPSKWKESDVKSSCAAVKLRYELNKKVAAVFLPDQNAETTDVLPDAISQVPEQYQELTEKIWKGTFDKQPEKAIERAQAILKSIQLTDLELMEDCGYKPIVYDIWNFNELDEKYGKPHPGNIPAGILFNVLYYWTEQGDLVIDPMAGGGVTIDVCKAMRRKCVAYDIDPKRQDIRKQNAEEPWPDRDAALVFIDPPYFTMMKEHYHPDGVSGAENIEEFLTRMKRVFGNAVEALKPGGHIAVIVQNQTGRNVEMGKEYIDISFLFFSELLNLGLNPVRRVSVPLNTQTCTAQQVEKAKKERRMLGLVRDLLIFRKEKLPDG